MLKRQAIPLFALLLTALFVSACGSATTTTGTPSKLTPSQILQNSANTMKQLKSAHVELQNTTAIQGLGSAIASASGTPAAGALTPTPAAGTPNANNASIKVTGTGDELLPDAAQFKLTLNKGTTISQVLQGNKVYIQNAQGKWYVLDKAALQSTAGGSTFSGFNVDQNSLLGLLQHAKITDHGDQQLNGESLRHITADLDKQGLSQLIKDNPQFGGSGGQQNIDAVLAKTKTFQSSVDVWIDEAKYYVHRTEVKISLGIDASAASGTPTATGATPKIVTTSQDSIIDLSKFNDPVTITPPANATPTNDPTVVLGGVGNAKP